MVRGPEHTEVLHSMLFPWARKEEWEEHLLPWLLLQHLPTLCGSTPCTQATAGAAVRLPWCCPAGGPWEAYWLLQCSGTSHMQSACMLVWLLCKDQIWMQPYNSVSTWCSHTQLTAQRSFSWRRDHRIGNLRGQGISAPLVIEASKSPTFTALWIARWLAGIDHCYPMCLYATEFWWVWK